MTEYRSAYSHGLQPEPKITPAMVEAAISKAGREKVFALARARGRGNDNPPLFVWYQLAIEAMTLPDAPWKPYQWSVNASER